MNRQVRSGTAIEQRKEYTGLLRTVLRTMLQGAGLGGIFLTGAISQQTNAPQPPVNASLSPVTQHRAALNKYCVTCHNERLKTAGLMLDKANLDNVPADAEIWEKVILKLRTGSMPPAGAPRPDQATYDSLATYLETGIDRAAFAQINPLGPTAHRLNRVEYVNAVRDLLSLQIDGDSFFAADDTGYGFDNNGDVLSVSPTLLDRFVTAARKVSRMAVGDPGWSLRPSVERYDVDFKVKQDGRMSENVPFLSRGGTSILHQFPADGEYVIKVRLSRSGDRVNGDGGTIRGIGLKRQLDLRVDGERAKQFAVGGERFPDPTLQMKYDQGGADANLEVRLAVKAGPHSVAASFSVEDRSKSEGVNWGGVGTRGAGNSDKRAEPGVDSITISGPYNPKSLGDSPSRKRIFICHPQGSMERDAASQEAVATEADERACADKILRVLARRAFRRSITEEDFRPLMRMYNTGRSEGGFESGIRMSIERILISPKFLFRIERPPANTVPGSAYRLNDFDLASRLSFFLWSSIPDDVLLEVAERGKLRDPAVLEQQVRRMLQDPRSNALVTNFFGQWLQLRHLDQMTPDQIEFPNFVENLRGAFREETQLFLESMVREDHPLRDLLDADYTFVNDRLAKLYGIPNVYGSSFRRVTLTDQNRRGLLGQGSILALTSYPVRTSVVLRGVWLLTNILGTPPPAPPANVPALEDRGKDGKIKSVRQSMEAHRKNPVCASCHSRMDPLGFALENFDAIGAWRTTEGAEKTPIDTSGTLPDGTKIDGPIQLRQVFLSKIDQFANVASERLLTYALGRGVEYYDQPFVRKIRQGAAPDYRWSTLILGVVQSEAFQTRKEGDQ